MISKYPLQHPLEHPTRLQASPCYVHNELFAALQWVQVKQLGHDDRLVQVIVLADTEGAHLILQELRRQGVIKRWDQNPFMSDVVMDPPPWFPPRPPFQEDVPLQWQSSQ